MIAAGEGTESVMDSWLGDRRRSELYSDEGTVFGGQGIGPWSDSAKDLELWLLRWN